MGPMNSKTPMAPMAPWAPMSSLMPCSVPLAQPRAKTRANCSADKPEGRGGGKRDDWWPTSSTFRCRRPLPKGAFSARAVSESFCPGIATWKIAHSVRPDASGAQRNGVRRAQKGQESAPEARGLGFNPQSCGSAALRSLRIEAEIERFGQRIWDKQVTNRSNFVSRTGPVTDQ
jgi:hypothetical protein